MASTSSPPFPPPSTTPSSSSSEEPGKETVARITRAFRDVEEDAAARSGALSAPLYLRACGSTVRLHEHIFGAGSFVSRLLGRTTTRHMGCVSAVREDPATPPEARASLQRLLAWEKESAGVDGVRRNRLSACHTTLWLHRGVCFVQTFMELTVSDVDLRHSPRACASAAYQLTLRPYHSVILGGLFRAAVSFAPQHRADMFASFGWADDARALADIASCAAAMRPVTRRVGDFLRREGLDFPDKVGSPIQQK